MATLTVWKFDTPGGADQAVNTLKDLANERLITVHDAAAVTWPDGAKKPKTHQLTSLAGAGALGGAFWGMLFGLLLSSGTVKAVSDFHATSRGLRSPVRKESLPAHA